ncbi:MAG: hypothetical protein QW782_09305 [Candidatus Bathyarchaeia archaeon]
MVHIVISKFGKINDSQVKFITGLMEECYGRLSPHNVTIVDLYVFEKSSAAEAFLSAERRELGVGTSPFHEGFFAMHDAWRGIPRIILCLDRMMKLPDLVMIGGVRHEVAHTVLHGSLEYYLFTFPESMLKLMNQFNLSEKVAADILYLISIAVKDYEVTRLLYEHGYVEDQAAYVKFLLKTEEDLLSWRLAEGNPLLEALHVIGLLKSIGCAIALLSDRNLQGEIECYLKDSLSHLPKNISSMVLNIAKENFTNLKGDTFTNIERTIYACKQILNTLMDAKTKI